jgi:hypothetical protein
MTPTTTDVSDIHRWASKPPPTVKFTMLVYATTPANAEAAAQHKLDRFPPMTDCRLTIAPNANANAPRWWAVTVRIWWPSP